MDLDTLLRDSEFKNFDFNLNKVIDIVIPGMNFTQSTALNFLMAFYTQQKDFIEITQNKWESYL